MKTMALTGGIGSGKSTVAKILAENGLAIVDADRIARDIVQPGQPALQQLAQAFGDDIIDGDGSLKRKLLAERAFASQQSTEMINSITHPLIAAEARRRIEKAKHTPGVRAVVYDVPLVTETGGADQFDEVIVVEAPAGIRIDRLVTNRGFTAQQARRRIDSQASDRERRAIATVIIDNSGDLDHLRRQVEDTVLPLV
ncbi:dephospho-CoA kinase [Corynebacterium sp. CCM 8862]|uniref:Dephospho-CoA kinase n=2 Tax=Corynebacterium mendelii TaxID=2765362 RepID=A0A939E175_9CORY|nr:dephospho-CoA kinase [Corynebacterium mendelii]